MLKIISFTENLVKIGLNASAALDLIEVINSTENPTLNSDIFVWLSQQPAHLWYNKSIWLWSSVIIACYSFGSPQTKQIQVLQHLAAKIDLVTCWNMTEKKTIP